jgi:hypothetical protein
MLSSEAFQRLNLAITAFTAIVSLMPMISMAGIINNKNDDITSFQEATGSHLIHRSPSVLASFFVVLIPALDLFLDFPAYVFAHFCPGEKLPSKLSIVARLSDVERLMFMTGMGILSCVWFLPLSVDALTLSLVYNSTSNASSVLVVGPILTYLQRCTTTFTDRPTTFIVTVGAAGVILDTMSNLYRDQDNDNIVYYFSVALLALAGLSITFLAAICLTKFYFLKMHTQSDRRKFFMGLSNPLMGSVPAIIGNLDKSIDNDREMYTNYIPALHMASCLIILFANSSTYLADRDELKEAIEKKNYIILIAEIVVLVIELRIRKNEITRGLVRTTIDHYRLRRRTYTTDLTHLYSIVPFTIFLDCLD